MAASSAARSHASRASRASRPGTDERDNDEIERVSLSLRTAVGDSSEVVDLSGCRLTDPDIKLLVRLLEESEEASKQRLKAAQDAYRLAEKAKAELSASSFNAFEPDYKPDTWELNFQEAMKTQWPDDPLWERQPAADPAQRTGTSFDASADQGPQISYRFTPRDQRPDGWERARGTKLAHNAGRAKLLFKHAMRRYNLRQKSLIADAASTAVDYHEAGKGCHQLLLQANQLGSLACAHLGSQLRGSGCLETLALGGNSIGDTGAALLGRALQHARSLKTLALQDCGISHKGVRHLSGGLALNRKLTSLWLMHNEARDEGAAHLASALRTCKLERLGLESNGLGRRGCEALAFALAHERCLLATLNLQHNALGDDGVQALAKALTVNDTLTNLSLRAVGIGEKGCMHLANAVRQTAHHVVGLRSLHLEDNQLTSQATEPLLRAMQGSKSFSHLALDMDHGGDYATKATAEMLHKTMTIALLANKTQPKKDALFG